MLALKEFANFIILNVANLATAYDRLLAENDEAYNTLPVDTRMASARRLIKVVAEACEAGTPDPFRQHFDVPPKNTNLLGGHKSPQPLLQIECLGQTLTPVVTNLEAGKFLWQILADARAQVFNKIESSSIPASPLPPEEGADLNTSEQFIQRQNEQLRQLSTAVEQSANTIVITDTNGYIQYVNRKFTETTGYTREEALGQHTRLLKSGLTSAEEYKKLWEIIVAGGEWQGEFCNKKKNGETYWEFASISPIKDEHGVITHFLAVKEEITQRRQVEQALEQERNLLRTLIDNLPDYIYAKDTKSRFTLVNQATAQVMGATTPEEVIGKTDFDFYPEELATQYYADEQQLIHLGQSLLNKEEPVVDAAGNQHWLSTSKVLLQVSQGNTIGFVGIGRDITKRKQLEQQAQESLSRRTRQVQLSSQLALDIATSTDITGLSKRIVTAINKQLDYYHTQLLLTDPATNTLIPSADCGQSGQQILTDRQSISLTYDLISRAAVLGTSLLQADVSANPHWRPHLLLSNIKGELAVPIKSGMIDVQAQASALKHFIADGLDGFVVFAIEPSVIAPLTKEALDQGLRVVAKGNDLGEDNQTAGVMVDEYEVGHILGQQAGEWAKTHLPANKTLKVGVLNYCVLAQVVQREEGIIAGIRAVFGDNLEIVGNETAADPVVALPIAEGWLKRYSDLDMIVAINDAAALGAYRAVVAAGRDDPNTFFVGGVDGVEEALAAIKSGGAYQATVDNSPVVMGVTALRTLVAAIVGRPYERAPLIEEAPINQSNIDEFLGVERRLPPDENLAGLDLSGLKIGLSVMTLTNPFFAALAKAVQQEAEQLGLELFINDPVEVLGVLDVCSDVAGALNLEDQLVLEGLCAQLTMAITNQRLEARRRQAEARLVDERNLMRTLIDHLPDQIYVKDTESRFLLVNPAVARNLKVATPDQVVGKTDVDFLPPEVAEQHYNKERALLQSGQPEIDAEESGFDPEMGITRWILSTKIPFHDNQGQVAGLVGLNRDITPLKQAQETIAKTLADTEALYQASADLNLAQTYEDILTVLRRYTLMGQGAQNVNLSYFDRPWTDNQLPTWAIVLARYSELPLESVSPRYPLNTFPLIHQFLRADAPTLVEDVQHDPRFSDKGRMLYEQRFKAKSTLFVPLVAGGQWIGLLNAIYQQPTLFPETEIRRLMLLAGQAAVAVQAILRLTETERQVRREQTIREITEKMRAATSLQDLVKTTARELGQRLSAGHAVVELGIEPDKTTDGHDHKG